MSRFRFGILGGDYRYKILMDMLMEDGYFVKAYCNDFIEERAGSVDELLDGIDVLIGPIPCTKDNKHIFVNDCSDIKIDKFIEGMYNHGAKMLIAGVVTNSIIKEAVKYNIKTFDFFEQEEVAVKNAVPTAEGAIQTAMQESIRTIFGSSSLVLGYGRCGKILSNMLKGMGANVTATYRNEKDSAYIKAYGMNGLNLCELKSYIKNFDFVFNTIPHLVINKDILKRMDKNTIIIDIAQAPGGVDFNFARDINIRAFYCPGLPGRVAPYTAAQILKDAAVNLCLNNF